MGRRVARADPGRRRVIDLKRLRDEPEYRRGIERKRVRAGLIDDVLAIDETHRALVTEVEGLRARQNAASKEIGKAAPDERTAKIEAAAQLKEELAAKEPVLHEFDAGLRELALQVPNPADASVPDGGEDDGVAIKQVGVTENAPPLDHAALRRGDRFRRHRARRGGERLALCVHHGRGGAARARARQLRDGGGRRARLHAGGHAHARARAHDGGGRVLPDRPRPGVRRRRRRAVPRRYQRGAALGAAPRRHVHARRAADALRRVLVVLPARSRHVRQGHARDLPRPPVRQGRDVLVVRPTSRGTSTSASSRSRSRSSAGSGSRTTW